MAEANSKKPCASLSCLSLPPTCFHASQATTAAVAGRLALDNRERASLPSAVGLLWCRYSEKRRQETRGAGSLPPSCGNTPFEPNPRNIEVSGRRDHILTAQTRCLCLKGCVCSYVIWRTRSYERSVRCRVESKGMWVDREGFLRSSRAPPSLPACPFG